jgi:hypothetical protein
MGTLTFKMNMEELIADIEEVYNKANLEVLAKAILASVREGMRKHINTDNIPLLPYQPDYRLHKIKKGFNGQVDFVYKGYLYRGLKYKVNKYGFSIYPNTKRNKVLMEIWALSGYKNWTVFQWGKRLNKVLEEGIEEIFEETLKRNYVAS